MKGCYHNALLSFIRCYNIRKYNRDTKGINNVQYSTIFTPPLILFWGGVTMAPKKIDKTQFSIVFWRGQKKEQLGCGRRRWRARMREVTEWGARQSTSVEGVSRF